MIDFRIFKRVFLKFFERCKVVIIDLKSEYSMSEP